MDFHKFEHSIDESYLFFLVLVWSYFDNCNGSCFFWDGRINLPKFSCLDHSFFNCSHVKVNDCSVPQLKTVMQLLSNIENCQLKTLSSAQAIQQVLQSSLTPPPTPTPEMENSPRGYYPSPVGLSIVHIFI